VAPARRHLAGRLEDVEPDGPRAREGDGLHVGVADERRADLALAGQQRDRSRGHAARAQGLDEHRPAARRLLGRLEDRRVARGQGGRRHPEGDGDREVPRGDDADDAAGPVAQVVALPGDLEERGARSSAIAPRA
jgi:hypothetical protein